MNANQDFNYVSAYILFPLVFGQIRVDQHNH